LVSKTEFTEQAMKPIVSVIMSTYNRCEYLKEAIDSILSQTFEKFEFIILNDGSTDDTRNIILSYDDARIRFHDFHENLGYTFRLNQAISLAQGKYIARMDSDDLSCADRLELQIEYLEANQDVAVCGGLIEFIGDIPDNVKNWAIFHDPETMKIALLFNCPICHPTVVFKKAIIEKTISYNESFEPAEDYELWTRLSIQHKIMNLPKVLLKYRFSGGQVSNKTYSKQRNKRFRIFNTQLNRLNIFPNSHQLRLHESLFHPSWINIYCYNNNVRIWFDTLIAANNISCIYEREKFVTFLEVLFLEVTQKSPRIIEDMIAHAIEKDNQIRKINV